MNTNRVVYGPKVSQVYDKEPKPNQIVKHVVVTVSPGGDRWIGNEFQVASYPIETWCSRVIAAVGKLPFTLSRGVVNTVSPHLRSTLAERTRSQFHHDTTVLEVINDPRNFVGSCLMADHRLVIYTGVSKPLDQSKVNSVVDMMMADHSYTAIHNYTEHRIYARVPVLDKVYENPPLKPKPVKCDRYGGYDCNICDGMPSCTDCLGDLHHGHLICGEESISGCLFCVNGREPCHPLDYYSHVHHMFVGKKHVDGCAHCVPQVRRSNHCAMHLDAERLCVNYTTHKLLPELMSLHVGHVLCGYPQLWNCEACSPNSFSAPLPSSYMEHVGHIIHQIVPNCSHCSNTVVPYFTDAQLQAEISASGEFHRQRALVDCCVCQYGTLPLPADIQLEYDLMLHRGHQLLGEQFSADCPLCDGGPPLVYRPGVYVHYYHLMNGVSSTDACNLCTPDIYKSFHALMHMDMARLKIPDKPFGPLPSGPHLHRGHLILGEHSIAECCTCANPGSRPGEYHSWYYEHLSKLQSDQSCGCSICKSPFVRAYTQQQVVIESRAFNLKPIVNSSTRPYVETKYDQLFSDRYKRDVDVSAEPLCLKYDPRRDRYGGIDVVFRLRFAVYNGAPPELLNLPSFLRGAPYATVGTDYNASRGINLVTSKLKSTYHAFKTHVRKHGTPLAIVDVHRKIIPNAIENARQQHMILYAPDVDTVDLSEKFTAHVTSTPVGFGACITTLQWFLDQMLGYENYIDQSYDAFIDSRHIELYEDTKITIPFAKYDDPKPMDVVYKPLLHTTMPLKRRNNVPEIVHALYKRNLNVPMVDGVVAKRSAGDDLFDNFVHDCLTDTTPLPPVETSYKQAMDWYHKQFFANEKMLETDLDIWRSPLDHYKLGLKPLPKPGLTRGSVNTYAAPQTLVYTEKFVNFVFSPIFCRLMKFYTGRLKSHIIVYSEMSPEQLCQRMNEIPHGHSIAVLFGDDSIIFKAENGGQWIEVDMSKYDKSQGEDALQFECRLMQFGGVPQQYVDLWRNFHEYSYVRHDGTGVKAQYPYQRHSGDPATACGNTWFLTALLSRAIGLHSGPWNERAAEDFLAGVHNMSIKISRRNIPYFCSKFMVRDAMGGWRAAPDPLKMLIKIGRSDMRTAEHLYNFAISVKDHVAPYKCFTVCRYVALGLHERYGVIRDFSIILGTLPQLLRDVKSLYEFDRLNYVDNLRK